MNRKNLTAAVLAGLAGAAGIASTAQAVNLNYDGLGDVLIYPYYTTNEGNLTVMSVVNTSHLGKAVKVRFLESQNSQEVLDFNLYLSAYDVWAAAIVRQDDGDETDAAGIAVTDTSCTVPTIEGQSDQFQRFFNEQYAGILGTDGKYVGGDDGDKSLARAREGYIEIIEMGTIAEGSAVEQMTTHVDGRPKDCMVHNALWDPVVEDPDYEDFEGGWIANPDFGLDEPSGGLFGGGAVINPADGTLFSYDARALEDFATEIDHTNPGSTSPSLNTGKGAALVAHLYNPDTMMVDTYSYDSSADAVSALFMHDALMNEYNIEDLGGGVMAATEWVVTFPTKRFYVQGTVAEAPFTSVWSDNFPGGDDADDINDGACEIVNLGGEISYDNDDYDPIKWGLWDREELTWDPDEYQCTDSGDPVFSPQPPNVDQECFPVDTVFMCHEVTVIRFGETDVAEGDLYGGPTEILGTTQAAVTNIDVQALIPGAESGWMRLNLFDATNPNNVDDNLDPIPVYRWLIDEQGQALGGLPATGFMAYRARNEFAETNQEGVLATQHYGGLFDHKATRLTSMVDLDD
jgi:hypothetical protein